MPTDYQADLTQNLRSKQPNHHEIKKKNKIILSQILVVVAPLSLINLYFRLTSMAAWLLKYKIAGQLLVSSPSSDPIRMFFSANSCIIQEELPRFGLCQGKFYLRREPLGFLG